MSGGGITAAGLLVLLLALIGLAVGLYYAYICLRARPVRPRQHTDCEDGPLIIVDPDVNGNHEDVPVEASAPLDEESDQKRKLILDDVDNGKVVPSESNALLEGTPIGPGKEKESILVPIEEKTEPAKLIHENETAPAVNIVAPLGFTVPNSTPSNVTPIYPQTPRRVISEKQERAEPEVHHPINSPVPVFIPVPAVVLGKKPVTDSDEEDGLLLQKCTPHDDSLDRESCPELSGPPEVTQESPVLTVAPALDDEAIDNSPPAAHPDKLEESEGNRKPGTTFSEAPDSVVVNVLEDSTPSDEAIKCPPQPVIIKEDVENLHPLEETFDAPVVFQISAGDPDKTAELNKEDQNVEQKVEDPLEPDASSVVNDVAKKDADICYDKSPVDDPQGSEDSSSLDDVIVNDDHVRKDTTPEGITRVPENTTHEGITLVPEVSSFPEVVYLETSEPYPGNKETEHANPSDENITYDKVTTQSTVPEQPITSADVPAVISDVRCPETVGKECVEIPEVVVTSETPAPPDVEETETVSEECIEIPEVVVTCATPAPPDVQKTEPVSKEFVDIPEAVVTSATPTPDVEKTETVSKECVELPEVVVTCATPAPPDAEETESVSKECVELPEVVVTCATPAPPDAQETEPDSKECVEIPEVLVTFAQPDVEETESVNKKCVEIPEVVFTSATPAPPDVGDTESLPLEVESVSRSINLANEDHEVPHDVPLEAEGSYFSDSMDEGNTLEVIREEGSIDTESETSDTETSEPEVTQYTFACGSLVPSTAEILADEISSSTEPEVTKYSIISELDPSDNEFDSFQEEDAAECVKPLNVISRKNGTGDPSLEHQNQPSSHNSEAPASSVVPLKELPTVDGEESDVDSSETESEGEETESGMKEKLAAPSTADRTDVECEADAEISDSEAEVKIAPKMVNANPQNKPVVVASAVIVPENLSLRDGKGKSDVNEGNSVNSTGPIPQVTIVNVPVQSGNLLSNSSTSSSASDVSDDEVTSIVSNKSKIPRLVERQGS